MPTLSDFRHCGLLLKLLTSVGFTSVNQGLDPLLKRPR
jgi:hypothetical protein